MCAWETKAAWGYSGGRGRDGSRVDNNNSISIISSRRMWVRQGATMDAGAGGGGRGLELLTVARHGLVTCLLLQHVRRGGRLRLLPNLHTRDNVRGKSNGDAERRTKGKGFGSVPFRQEPVAVGRGLGGVNASAGAAEKGAWGKELQRLLLFPKSFGADQDYLRRFFLTG